MMYTKLSKKQKRVFTWHLSDEYDALICDGAIRSGKTLSMSVSFVLWACYRFNRSSFALCGKTVESLRRNVVTPLHAALEGIAIIQEKISQNYLEITADGHTNRFYMFGGKDESSRALIQGITLAGVLFDEVSLMPRSFVEQALARCSVDGSKFWFNCNPEHPQHWFLLEWIKKADEKRALHLHFTMEDNLSLSQKVKERYERLYTGVFYDRYIKGEWVKAEGLVYPMFDRLRHLFDDDSGPRLGRWFVSVDYGTKNPTAALLWCVSGGVAYCMDEYYYDGRKNPTRTDEEHTDAIIALMKGKPVECIVADPSAASFIECIRRRLHSRDRVVPANNDVVPGIQNIASALHIGRLSFHKKCKETINEFGLYVWDEKSGEDKPKKENDHAMDSIRYFVRTILRSIVPQVAWSVPTDKKGVTKREHSAGDRFPEQRI